MYSELDQTTKIFEINGFNSFTTFAKSSILDVWLNPLYASEITVNNQCKSPGLTNSLRDKNTIFYLFYWLSQQAKNKCVLFTFLDP